MACSRVNFTFTVPCFCLFLGHQQVVSQLPFSVDTSALQTDVFTELMQSDRNSKILCHAVSCSYEYCVIFF
jgi:hypothetical protein